MNESLRLVAKKLAHRFPSTLPTGMEELKEFTRDIVETHDIPNLPSYHHAVASMIMHLGQTTVKCPKIYFVHSIKKAMANEVAYQRMQDIKEETKPKEVVNDKTTPVTTIES